MSSQAKKPRVPSPPEAVAALRAQVEQGRLPRAVLLKGEEHWFRDESVRMVVEAAGKQGLELCRHDTRDPDFRIGALTDELLAPPMFAAARAIIVREATPLLKKDDKDDAVFVRCAIAHLESEKDGLLVVEAEGLRADSKLAKAVLGCGGVLIDCRKLYDTPPPWKPDPRETELAQWTMARARLHALKVSAEECVWIAAACGNDLQAVDAALLRAKARGNEGLKSVVGWSSGASPFQVAEDLARGDGKASVAGVESLFSHGFRGSDGAREVDKQALLAVLFGALRGKLRQSCAGATVLERGGTVEAAAQLAGVPPNPRARDEFELRLRTRSAAQWRAQLLDLARLERRSRSGVEVDVADLVAFALRHRRDGVARPR